MWYYIVALINVYTNTQGLSTLFKKSAWNLVYPVDFWDTQEIREILLVDLRDWKLKNTDFSRENKTPDWCMFEDFQGVLSSLHNCNKSHFLVITERLKKVLNMSFVRYGYLKDVSGTSCVHWV